MNNNDLAFLATLEDIVRRRLEERPDGSYTASLAAAGMRRMAQKVGEEGVELAIAAAAGNRDEVIDEAADLLYHVLAVLAGRDVRIREVVDALESRHSEAN